MNYYHAGGSFAGPRRREPRPYSPGRRPDVIIPQRPPSPGETACGSQRTAFAPQKSSLSWEQKQSALRSDDLLLLGVIALLVWNSCNDTLLLLALGYLFFAGL